MKLTITIDGVVNITERWEAGSLAHEQRFAGLPAQPVELSIEHSDVDAILGQAESFLLSSISDGREHVRMPSTVLKELEISALLSDIEGLKSRMPVYEREIAGQREMIETMSVWKTRANEALEAITSLQKLLAGQAVRWPRGLRKRITALRSGYPVSF